MSALGSAVVAVLAVLAMSGGDLPVQARLVTPAPPTTIRTWVDAWTTSPQSSGSPGTTFTDQTVRIITHLHATGAQVRVRLSNAYGDQDVVFGAVALGVRSSGAGIVPGTARLVTFGGAAAVTVAKGGEVHSDATRLTVKAGEDLAVSVYLPVRTGTATVHPLALQTNYLAAGDHARDLDATTFIDTTGASFFVTAVSVLGEDVSGAVVAIGDSITDGTCSTPDANHRWPDLLSDRLVAAYGAKARPVLDEGIRANRVLADDPNHAHHSALNRLERDVLQRAGVTDVILLEGVNDLQNSVPPATANQLIAGYEQIIASVHARHVRIFGATILPLGGSHRYTPQLEQERSALNTWIRTSGRFDGVIDFDAAVRDPADPNQLRPAYSCDRLHPDDAGYQAMADAVDITLFR